MMISFVVLTLLVIEYITDCEGCYAGRQIIRSGGLTPYDKQMIVDAHNRLRQSVALGQISPQPPAANMMEMEWDEELAARAQRWANQCQQSHDLQTQRDVGRFPVGQNVAATWTSRRPSTQQDYAPDFNKQINAWFDEVSIFGFKPITRSYGNGRKTGHYSQLVWGETSKVGCGFTFYYDRNLSFYTKLYVCNYGPGGNVVGAKPYVLGQPSCGSYGLAESAKYSGLCVVSYDNYEEVDNGINYVSNVIPDSSNENQYNTYYDDGSYHYDHHYNNYQTWSMPSQPVTYKPFVNLINSASNIFTKAKQNTAQSFSILKPNGFKFGFYY